MILSSSCIFPFRQKLRSQCRYVFYLFFVFILLILVNFYCIFPLPLITLLPSTTFTHSSPHITTLLHPIFIAVLFTIAKIWKQPKYPSVDEWMKQLWYIYTMEYYSAIKKEEGGGGRGRGGEGEEEERLSLIHISEPTRPKR